MQQIGKQMQTKSQPARKSCSMCPGTVGRGRLWHFPDGEFPSLWCLPPVSTPPLLDGPDAPEKESNYFPQVLFKSGLNPVEQILPGCPAISKWKPSLGISTRALERSFPQIPILPKFVLEASASKQKLRWELWFVFSLVQVNTYGAARSKSIWAHILSLPFPTPPPCTILFVRLFRTSPPFLPFPLLTSLC